MFGWNIIPVGANVLKGYYQPLSILLDACEEAWVGFVRVCEWARVHKDLGLVE